MNRPDRRWPEDGKTETAEAAECTEGETAECTEKKRNAGEDVDKEIYGALLIRTMETPDRLQNISIYYFNGVSHNYLTAPQGQHPKWKRTTRAVSPQREEN